MKLGRKQEIFAQSLQSLLEFIHAHGWHVRLRELQRTKEQAEIYAAQGKGILNSNHRNCLAIDLYIVRNGSVLWDGTEYALAASHWQGLSTRECEHCWGGDFARRDVYHYSIKHGGVV